MTARESWHLPPDLSALLVAGLWLAAIVTLVIVGVRLILSRQTAEPDQAAAAELRKTLGIGMLAAGLCSAAILLLVLGGVHLRWWLGVSEEAVLVSKRIDTGGRSSTPTWMLLVDSDRVGEIELFATQEYYESLQPGALVPVVTVPGVASATQIGSRTTVNAGFLFVAGFLLLLPITNVLVLPWRVAEREQQ